MSVVPKLTYFAGRGRGETIRLILAANNVKFEEFDLTERAQFENLLDNGSLLFRQVPLLEIDGLIMVQSAAICRYLARKYKMSGDDSNEEYRIDMLHEGAKDFLAFFMDFGFMGNDDDIVLKAKKEGLPRYMPIFEKILQENSNGYLVHNHLTLADIALLEVLLNVEERLPAELAAYPALQGFMKKLKSIPSLGDYLANTRPPQPDPGYVSIVKKVLNF